MSAVTLPIVCAWCGRVRTRPGCWEQPGQQPLSDESTHGICPECLVAQTREAAGVIEYR